MENSQLHDEIVVGATLVELLHPHHVLVLDPGGTNKIKRMGVLFPVQLAATRQSKEDRSPTSAAQRSRSPG